MATDSVSEARAMVYRGLMWHTVREEAGAVGGQEGLRDEK